MKNYRVPYINLEDKNFRKELKIIISEMIEEALNNKKKKGKKDDSTIKLKS